ncbi:MULTISPECIES: hypothetical protein [Legionella]|uniref:Coiled-coil protein n=1 Tax=Legionella resiliens TaxID=2905958 RepID=A0ABS8X7W5_9GAMM|nr:MULTISPECIES: hypothetical protein [unclassified Legionella]MCE0724368.1 hypothetical protein [Legionella sp. 9fVS26]MCE3533520.1 hypothetical protein [Legionella sp. 8cVS16]QLZ69708.1 hypothetical protein FOLKNPGA_02506 [Legionella sp. PC1000]
MFTISDLERDIYLEGKGPLAHRIDFAWEIYSDETSNEQNQKHALKFLIYAFDLTETEDINEQLISLMDDRNKYKEKNPYYIPGKAPKSLSQLLEPAQRNLEDAEKQDAYMRKALSEARAKKEILSINKESQEADRELQIRYLSPEERAKHNIVIRDKRFLQNGEPVNTSGMISHGKRGYAAFTLNANGELYIFAHNEGIDHIAHSSMTAGSPVVAAGEIKIENGVLKAITTHSGHYRPSLFNLYRALEYFSHNKVDISQAVAVTFTNPSLKNVESKAVTMWMPSPVTRFETPADKVYKSIDKILDENIQSISKDITNYRSSILTSIYKIKDKVLGSTLTEDRAKVASGFVTKLTEFKQKLNTDLTSVELNDTIKSLNKLITDHEEHNKALAKGGRLESKFCSFKEHLLQVHSEYTGMAEQMKYKT